ncbi:MAG: sulfite exporter TauE/SafE family protein [Pseudorhodoplanes sp.]
MSGVMAYFADAAGYPPDVLALLAAAAFLAGLARGFSGFGSALIFMPLASALTEPKVAAPLLLIADLPLSAWLVPRAWPYSNKRDVALISLGALVCLPLGALVLAHGDPVMIRWMQAFFLLPLVLLLMAGWRYHSQPHAGLTVLAGGVSGFLSGVAQLGGPPVVLYWLGGSIRSDLVRANIISYFAISTTIALISFFATGLITRSLLWVTVLAMPAYTIGAYFGTRMFGLASEVVFRRICYALILGSIVVGLPIMDKLR